MLLLVLKEELVMRKAWSRDEQDRLLQDAVDEALLNGVLITRLKAMPSSLHAARAGAEWQPTPALKVCVTTALTRKEVEKAGTVIRHAATKVVTRRK